MINSLSKINLSKIGWEGGGSTSIWIMSLNILFVFFDGTPNNLFKTQSFVFHFWGEGLFSAWMRVQRVAQTLKSL